MKPQVITNHTRIAPTPSGYLHLGNAYSFLLTAAFAKQHNADILLRIDDLDRERILPAYVQDVFDTLELLGIQWQRGPKDHEEYLHTYSQMHRLQLYENWLGTLRNKGKLFACTCSRADLIRNSTDGGYPGACIHKDVPLDTPGVAWRLDTSAYAELLVKDISGAITQTTLPPAMRHFVVRKKDGYPAYQLASLADDVHFNINLIVRGADLWDSTLAQLYLAKLLGLSSFDQALFHHHPLKLSQTGEKLSKSQGSTSIQYLRKAGYTPEQIIMMAGM